jgi:hypothetical protein
MVSVVLRRGLRDVEGHQFANALIDLAYLFANFQQLIDANILFFDSVRCSFSIRIFENQRPFSRATVLLFIQILKHAAVSLEPKSLDFPQLIRVADSRFFPPLRDSLQVVSHLTDAGFYFFCNLLLRVSSHPQLGN